MSSELAIRVEALGKRYQLGEREPYRALRDVLMQPFHKRKSTETIWALKDVSFEIHHGEVIGIIGRNGAGKSTLLKILSRVTEPTEGQAEVYGRVGSLLEVGTGFHPELTGRENIYLNGAILGMRRAEIKRKFDEIVAFAETEQFLDTPVKHYSNGMRVRLAFAVAAHLEPEILLVDEVLAVGDAAFQKKCLGKMSEVASFGRTILFVSHNMATLLNFCGRGILLERGKVATEGQIQDVIRQYLAGLRSSASVDLRAHTQRQGRGRVRFNRVHFEDDRGKIIEQGISGQPLVVALEYKSSTNQTLQNARVAVAFSDSMGQALFNCWTEQTLREPLMLPPSGTIRCVIPQLPLTQSEYFLSPFLEVNREIEDWIQGAVVLSVADGDFFGTGKLYPEGWRGKGVLVPHQWIVE